MRKKQIHVLALWQAGPIVTGMGSPHPRDPELDKRKSMDK